MQKFNIPATVFITAGFVGEKKRFPWLEGKDNHFGSYESMPMNEEEIIQLHEGGIEIGSHTVYHTLLPKLDRQGIEEEILGSQYILEKILGLAPVSFAIPYSFPVKYRKWPSFEIVLKKALVRGNFTACCTMTRGHVTTKSSPFLLRRIAVEKYDDLLFFRAKLSGGYAWSRIPQKIFQAFFKRYN